MNKRPGAGWAVNENRSAGWSLTVENQCDGFRLDRFLALRIGRLSRSRAARLRVVDEDDPSRGPLKKSASVRRGQRLFAYRPVPDAEVNAPIPRLLFEDDELIIIDKPPGLAAHPTASRFVATVRHWLRQSGYGDEAEPLHRLDVETSGVLAIARTTTAARIYRRVLRERGFEKSYLAVVKGSPARSSWTSCEPLGFATDSEIRLKMGPGVLEAETHFEVLRRSMSRALVHARPVTGRQHQIRVHLSLSGHPIVGDKLYGPDEGLFLTALRRPLDSQELERCGHPRHALHAHRLTVPRAWGPQTFEAPLPPDLETLLETLIEPRLD